MKNFLCSGVVALFTATISITPLSAAETVKYKADVPANITTPNSVQTTYAGELKFVDGFPTEETVSKTYDFLDTARAAIVFTNTIGIASMQAML
jgi:hypothetical protein